MAAAFVPTQIVDVVIAAEATGHVFYSGTELWLG